MPPSSSIPSTSSPSVNSVSSTSIPATRRRDADYSTVAWALTAVTCFVLAVGIFVIRQVIDTPQRGGAIEEVPLAEQDDFKADAASQILVLRPEKPASDNPPEDSLPLMR